MKTFNDFINEKLKLNKDSELHPYNEEELIDRTFNDINELVEVLNVYFKDHIIEPIKINTQSGWGRKMDDGYSVTSNVYVQSFFEVKFSKTVKLLFGYNKHSGHLYFQTVTKPKIKWNYSRIFGLYKNKFSFNKTNFKKFLDQTKPGWYKYYYNKS